MNEKFEDWKPNGETVGLLNEIIKVLDEYRRLQYRLTLRQLYYQLVSRALIPNTVQSYHRIGNVVGRGRMAGILDWGMIEDRGRVPKRNSHWSNAVDVLEAAREAFYMDHWVDQDCHVEVWCEKDAVSNILQPVCSKWDVTFMANRGYSSQTAMYTASKRLWSANEADKKNVILYFGDHDPSGIDMTRDINDRLASLTEYYGIFEVVRIALNMDQVERYHPPRNPAKMTDSRYLSYVMKFGDSSWELDALDPMVLASLVENTLKEFVDDGKWAAVEEKQEAYREQITEMIKDWEDNNETTD